MCRRGREAFTLHGLWLNYDTGKWPQFCTHESFNASAVSAKPLLSAFVELCNATVSAAEASDLLVCIRQHRSLSYQDLPPHLSSIRSGSARLTPLLWRLSQITSLLPLMEQDWPSYYGPNEEFWAHEWEKHGTCAEDDFPTQLEYFNTTLALHVANPIEV